MGGAPGSDARARIAARLSTAREHGFVGRDVELAAFEDSLAGRSGVQVHFIHGLGGIGKSTLLDALARRSRVAGRTAIRLDADEVVCSVPAVTTAIEERGREAPDGGAPAILLVDGYDRLAPLDRWFREELVPGRPVGAITVLAGRDPPEPSWRLDPGWRPLVAVHELTGLDRTDSTRLLVGLGVAADDCGPMIDLGRGHPLVLAMLAEASRLGPVPRALRDAPALVGPLCRMIIDDVPGEAHLRGLETCAHVSRMTQDLLVKTVGPDATAVWEWLVSRPYVRRGAVGLYLHEVVRELFEAEIGHRAPDAYVALHRNVREYFVGRLLDPHEPYPDRAAAEILFMQRRGPFSAEIAALRAGGVPPVVRASSSEEQAIVELVGAEEGAEAATLARRWMDDPRTTVYRVRPDADVEAYSVQIALPSGTCLDAEDPVAAALLHEVERRGPLRPGERIQTNRFMGPTTAGQFDPLVFYANSVADILEWVRHPSAWNVTLTRDGPLYGPFMDYIAMLPLLTLQVGDRCVSAFGSDRRRFPMPALLELIAQRELNGETGPPRPDLLEPAPLSYPDFASAVRSALVSLRAPDRLAGSALLHTAVVDPTARDPVESLRLTLVQAISTVGAEPRGHQRQRVLETISRGSFRSHEQAAEALDLPYSTYRRYLAQAHERLVDLLWAVEIGQRPRPVAQQAAE